VAFTPSVQLQRLCKRNRRLDKGRLERGEKYLALRSSGRCGVRRECGLSRQSDKNGDRSFSCDRGRKRLARNYWATVMVAPFEVTPPLEALMVAVPTVTAVASPVVEMVATELGSDVQVEMAVTSAVEPSL
jgi:hypothetical protein